MKSAFLAALLLFVAQVSADDKPRLLRGVSDRTPLHVERGSKQDLVQDELPLTQDATSADSPARQLAMARRKSLPRGAQHPPPKKAHHPGATRGRPRQGAASSPQHGKMKAKGSGTGENDARWYYYYDDDDYYYYVYYWDDDYYYWY